MLLCISLFMMSLSFSYLQCWASKTHSDPSTTHFFHLLLLPIFTVLQGWEAVLKQEEMAYIQQPQWKWEPRANTIYNSRALVSKTSLKQVPWQRNTYLMPLPVQKSHTFANSLGDQRPGHTIMCYTILNLHEICTVLIYYMLYCYTWNGLHKSHEYHRMQWAIW